MGSDFIGEKELPKLLARKPVIPVALHRISRHQDHKGLKAKQLFGLKGSRIKPFKPYYDCTPQQRTRFVEQLYDGIEERLHKLFPRAANAAS